jgi:DNA mismatch repair protein MutS2
MHPKYLRILEYPKILEQLAGHTAFSASQALALALTPSNDLEIVRRRQAETLEASSLLDTGFSAGIGGARDVRALLEDVRRGITLLPAQLLDIKATLLSGRSLRNAINKVAGQFPLLAEMAGRIEECAGLVAELSRCLDERGEVLDDASPALARIRRDLRLAHARLLEHLNRLLSGPDTAQYLQEAIITQRNGRYVIPVKAEFKGRIPGLVHDQSGSGATLFVEPLATVELNNQWRSLQSQEEEEIHRILAALSERVNREGASIERTVSALADLDLALAKAKYARAIRARAPIITGFSRPRGAEINHPGVTLDLRQARHPLLDPQTVVPIDVRLGPDYFILVITGPNTGGKTISLKTVGLLAAMAQAGLFIPAQDDSQLSVFDNIFADIGDEQSIEQSLSTFSSHMTNIVEILEQADSHSLVLLDELGAGTDPEEGSALARAILSHLVRRGITTLATTHYSELKVYAHSTPGVQNASVEFDVETLSPTFKLTIGLPGRSNAFAIARRLGLSNGIVEEAAGMVSSESLEAESLLAGIKEAQRQALEERSRAAQERQEAERLRRELNEKLAEIEAARRDVLDEARRQARAELDALRLELEQMRAQAKETLQAATRAGELATLDRIEETVEQAAESYQPLETEPAPAEAGPWVLPQVGDTVWVDGLNVLAEVTELSGEEVEVQAGSFRVRVPTRSVVVRHHAPAPASEPSEPARRPALNAPRPPLELDLRGLRAEEALIDLDRYLNDAVLSDLPWARIVHGKGTGALRQAVRAHLSAHPLVASYRAGDDKEGGDGVTVVTFSRS